jgi:hypothetical protein
MFCIACAWRWQSIGHARARNTLEVAYTAEYVDFRRLSANIMDIMPITFVYCALFYSFTVQTHPI